MDQFHEIWYLDFEFRSTPGDRPIPHCLVALELRSRRKIRLWLDRPGPVPPFDTGPDSLFVAYFASAELGCMLELGWPLPSNVLDLYVEHRNLTNGLQGVPRNLLGALTRYGLDCISAAEKSELRELAIRGGPYSQLERDALLDYCESDVVVLDPLLHAMLPQIDLPRALLRGDYMKTVAAMEHNGIPIDMSTLRKLQKHWKDIKRLIINRVGVCRQIYEGTRFRRHRFEALLCEQGIAWPRTESGTLALDDETFRQMSQQYPHVIRPIREVRHMLSRMRVIGLAVGQDGRNRCMISPFRSITGRNQPSNTKFIFGPSAWLRSLIKPPHGHAIAYVDYSQQEHGIAAALSGDQRMMEAYASGDPYLAFAMQAGAVPANATKRSHKTERELFKTCALAVQYGMTEFSLAVRLGKSIDVARTLLRQHRETYPDFWRWSQAAVDHANLNGRIQTVFGWNRCVTGISNPRSLSNHPCQANGAEMLRIACGRIHHYGVKLLAPVHDAVLIEAPVDDIDEAVRLTQLAMQEAAEIVLDGFQLRTDVEIIRYPDRYSDERGNEVWSHVMAIVHELEHSGHNDRTPYSP